MLSVIRLITTVKMTTLTKVNYYSKDDNFNMDKWLKLNTWFNVDESVIFSLTFYGGRLLIFYIFVIWRWQVLNNFEYFRFCCADKMKIQSVRYLITGYKKSKRMNAFEEWLFRGRIFSFWKANKNFFHSLSINNDRTSYR